MPDDNTQAPKDSKKPREPKEVKAPKEPTIEEMEAEYVELAPKVSAAAKKLTLDELAAITRGQQPTSNDGQAYAALKNQKAQLVHDINLKKGLV